MKTFQCWHVHVSQEYIEASSSFEARKIFAQKHHKQVSECMARLRGNAVHDSIDKQLNETSTRSPR
jgi:hypothetical protein